MCVWFLVKKFRNQCADSFFGRDRNLICLDFLRRSRLSFASTTHARCISKGLGYQRSPWNGSTWITSTCSAITPWLSAITAGAGGQGCPLHNGLVTTFFVPPFYPKKGVSIEKFRLPS